MYKTQNNLPEQQNIAFQFATRIPEQIFTNGQNNFRLLFVNLYLVSLCWFISHDKVVLLSNTTYTVLLPLKDRLTFKQRISENIYRSLYGKSINEQQSILS